MPDLCLQPAATVVQWLKSGKVSPLELTQAAIGRIEALEPRINALPIRFFDDALAAARAPIPGDPAHPGWLAGLPVAIKDYNDVRGQLTTYGSPLYARHVAPDDDRTVATLRGSGAIPLAKSNVPEFAGSHTFNPVWGITRNPWNPARTVGGSSGGAAAALAAHEVWLANGSCLGGSLRIPASFCGIVGMRPSPGVVPRGDGLAAFDSLWVDGPMARNVADLALMLDAMAAQSIHDPLSRPVPPGGYQAAMREGRPPRTIGFSADLGLRRIDPEVARICEQAALRLSDLGAQVSPDCPDFTGAIDCFQTLRALLFADVRGDLLARDRSLINPDILWNVQKGVDLSAAQIIEARRVRHRIFHAVARYFDSHDLLVCPTVAVPPFEVEQRFPSEIAGEKLTTYIDWMFLTFVLTLTGCPVISLPCGMTKDGMPVGVQLVGRPHGDTQLLGFARHVEALFGFEPVILRTDF